MTSQWMNSKNTVISFLAKKLVFGIQPACQAKNRYSPAREMTGAEDDTLVLLLAVDRNICIGGGGSGITGLEKEPPEAEEVVPVAVDNDDPTIAPALGITVLNF